MKVIGVGDSGRVTVFGDFRLALRSNGAREELSRAVDRVCCESHGENCFWLAFAVNKLAMAHVGIAGHTHLSSHPALSTVRTFRKRAVSLSI